MNASTPDSKRLIRGYGLALFADARRAAKRGPLEIIGERYSRKLSERLHVMGKGVARGVRDLARKDRIEDLADYLERDPEAIKRDWSEWRKEACDRFRACVFEAWRSEAIAAAKGEMTEAGRAQEEAWRAVDGGKRPEDFCPPTVTREEIAAPAVLSIKVGDAVYVASSIGADGIVGWSTAPPEPSGKASSRAVVTYSMDLMELHTLNPRRPFAFLTGLMRELGLRVKTPPEGSGCEAIERDEAEEKPDYDLIYDLMLTFGLCCPVLHREEDACDWLTILAGIRAAALNLYASHNHSPIIHGVQHKGRTYVGFPNEVFRTSYVYGSSTGSLVEFDDGYAEAPTARALLVPPGVLLGRPRKGEEWQMHLPFVSSIDEEDGDEEQIVQKVAEASLVRTILGLAGTKLAIMCASQNGLITVSINSLVKLARGGIERRIQHRDLQSIAEGVRQMRGLRFRIGGIERDIFYAPDNIIGPVNGNELIRMGLDPGFRQAIEGAAPGQGGDFLIDFTSIMGFKDTRSIRVYIAYAACVNRACTSGKLREEDYPILSLDEAMMLAHAASAQTYAYLEADGRERERYKREASRSRQQFIEDLKKQKARGLIDFEIVGPSQSRRVIFRHAEAHREAWMKRRAKGSRPRLLGP